MTPLKCARPGKPGNHTTTTTTTTTSSNVGDEFHIIMECPHSWLTKLRNLCQLELLKQIPQFSYLPIKEKFIYLISCADLICCKIVSP